MGLIFKKSVLVKKILVFFIFVIPLFLSGCLLGFMENSPYRLATEKELIMYSHAVVTNNLTLCYSLDSTARKKEYIFEYGSSFPLRAYCLYNIAIQTKNPNICEELMNKQNDPSPIPESRQDCIQKASR